MDLFGVFCFVLFRHYYYYYLHIWLSSNYNMCIIIRQNLSFFHFISFYYCWICFQINHCLNTYECIIFFCCISLLKYLTLIIIIITRPIRIQWWLLSFSFSLYFFLWKPPLFFFNSIHHHLHHVWTNIQDDDDDDDGEKRFDMDSWEIFLLYTHTHSLSSSLLIFNANTLCVATFFLMMND